MTFEACPWQGYLKYILKKEQQPNFGSETGKAVHSAIAYIINDGLELDEAISKARAEALLPISGEVVTKHVTAAAKYYKNILSQEGLKLKAEVEHNTVLSEDESDVFAPGLKMIFDLESAEKPFVGDWKTGQVEEAKDNFALGMYCWYKARQLGVDSCLGRLIFTGQNQTTEYLFTKKDFRRILERAEGIANKTKAALLQLSLGGDPGSLFPATKNPKCKYCPFPEDCPLKQAEEEEKAITSIDDYSVAVQVAREYQKLKAEASRLESLLKDFVKSTGEPVEADGLRWEFKKSQSWVTPKKDDERIAVFAEIAKQMTAKGVMPWLYFKADIPNILKDGIFTEDEIKTLGISQTNSNRFSSSVIKPVEKSKAV